MAAAVVRYVRSAPVTHAYLAVLGLTTLVLGLLDDRTADRLLLALSTNIRHLEHDPLRVLVGSAFWAPDGRGLLLCALLFSLVLAPVERRVGSLRTTAVFALGHVGASLLVGAGLWLALRADAVGHGIADARDVGTSYGFYAVAAAMTYLLAREVRPAYAALLVGYVAVSAGMHGGFGDYGHVVALAIGFASFPLVARAGRSDGTPILALPAWRGGQA